jgi:hypothetical protein
MMSKNILLSSYALGMLLVEPVSNVLGRFCLGRTTFTFLPYFPKISSLLLGRSPSSVGYSASQARFLALTIFSLLHASNFIMIGSQSGFSVTFLAYAVAAFARAFLVGQNHAHINYSRFSDAFRQRPCDFYNFMSSVFFALKYGSSGMHILRPAPNSP